ncbi:PKD domain-containing protein [Fluviicola taffensis]|uniref:PKD domain containing protein n=1 Tax=Fluviicola taffensis (strain DSM 16823 / NCIMB 13979 / RW262) TaxID=755732 RepID=F2IGK3_FLUTR|nr:PKD domain-containing protein [Fluviicola taffensis]AEA42609.1 PKD domain containing protein [Fluviicola taffensis DSM 16823]
MKKIILSLLGLTLIQSQLVAQDSISVLFIGNSYTYVNDLPGMLNSLTTSLGKETTVDSKTNGGYTFQNQVNDAATYVKIHSKPWDVVVIQGQSQEPSFPDSQVNTGTLPFALRLSDSIWANNACSNVMYYMTWGRQNGDPQWSGINTFEKMNTRLYNAYMRMADSSDRAMVSPVGAVWAYVRTNHPTINLYNADESHPSVEGTYLAACTFYASLFQQTPVGSTFYGGLNATTAGILQNAAAAVILDSLDHFQLHSVDEPTQANFSIVQNGGTIQLENKSSRAISYSWNFGDGQTANSVDAQHTYTSTGTFAVELTASSPCNSDVFSIQVQVTTLDLSDKHFKEVQIASKEDVIEVSSKELGYSLEVYSVDGRLLLKTTEINEVPISISRKAIVQLLKIKDTNGVVKIIRTI